MDKIGIGYITHSNVGNISQSFKTIPTGSGELVVAIDGESLPDELFDGATKIIHTPKSSNKAMLKNRALRYLIDKGCDHLFLIENDILIKDASVFRQYVISAQESGIWHLNYALQGGLNRTQSDDANIDTLAGLVAMNNTSPPAPRAKLQYPTSKVAFYPHAMGGFSYFYAGIIKNVGYFDERYPDSIEHIDYTYRVVKKGLHPPYWWFADIDNSDEYIGSLNDTSHRDNKQYGKDLLFAKQWFKTKFDFPPDLIPDVGETVALKAINELKYNYARKVI